MHRNVNELLERLAPPQASLVTRDQLVGAGLSGGHVDSLVRHGHVQPVRRAIYRVAGAAATWEHELRAALLAGGPDAVASHWTAATLLGLDGFQASSPIHISVPRGRRGMSTSSAFVIHSTRVLDRIDRVVIDGIPATSAARTVIDLAAAGASAVELGNAVDSAARLGRTTVGFVGRRLDALGRTGRRGISMLDAVTLDAGGHSLLERRFLALMRRAGVRRPTSQVVHRLRDVPARVDFEWKPERLIAEVNGRRGHASDRERAKDSRRRNALQQEGFEVLEFVTTQVLGEPDYVVASVSEALRRRGGQRKASHPVSSLTTSA